MANGHQRDNASNDETNHPQDANREPKGNDQEDDLADQPAARAFLAGESEEKNMAGEDEHEGQPRDATAELLQELRAIREEMRAFIDKDFEQFKQTVGGRTNDIYRRVEGLDRAATRTDEALRQIIDDIDNTGTRDALLDEMVDGIHGIGSRLNGSGGSGRRAGGALPGSTIDDTMLQVLGTRVRPNRPEDLRSALDRAFILKEEEGRTVVDYRGTSGTASLPVEQGYVSSGPQAVLFKSARAELGTVRQALQELSANIDDKQDEFEAVRDVVDHKITELVNVLGQDIRPTIPRVDALFRSLIGADGSAGINTDLGRLGKLVGFKGVLIDQDDMTRDDDRDSTRYLEVLLFVRNLFPDWQQIREKLKQHQLPLGTRLDVVARQLDRLAELNDDLDAELTDASVDSAERDFLVIQDDPETTMSELMEWISDFARGGKSFDSRLGIGSVKREAAEIDVLVQSARNKTGESDPPQGLKSRGVKQTLALLHGVLDGFKHL